MPSTRQHKLVACLDGLNGFRPDCRPGDKELRAQIACKQHSSQRVSERCLRTNAFALSHVSPPAPEHHGRLRLQRAARLCWHLPSNGCTCAFALQQTSTNSPSPPLAVRLSHSPFSLSLSLCLSLARSLSLSLSFSARLRGLSLLLPGLRGVSGPSRTKARP